MKQKRAIVWFRSDLRLHDNEAVQEALRSAEETLFVYIFDERIFKGKTKFGFPKTGKFRAQFILESVEDLRQNLQKRGADLIIRVGKPEDILFDLARLSRSSWVFCNRERTYEEVKVQDALEQKLWTVGQEMRYVRGKMLYYTADLPFPVPHTPDTFTQFRKETERITAVREPLPTPDRLSKTTYEIQAGSLPTLEDFGHTPFEDRKSVV